MTTKFEALELVRLVGHKVLALRDPLNERVLPPAPPPPPID